MPELPFELGTVMYTNIMLPEEAARWLRQVGLGTPGMA